MVQKRSGGPFRGQKGRGPLEKPRGIADYACFARLQKITSQTIRISGALVFLCTGAIIPLKIADYPSKKPSKLPIICLPACIKCAKKIDRNPRKNVSLAVSIRAFKGTVSPAQNRLKVVWLDRPWLGHP